ncbi:MAG: hypothetical protein HY326_05665 [Chloroflexi bacterium]|nr:hypothetical protein [Chloroflexota bacterium]
MANPARGKWTVLVYMAGDNGRFPLLTSMEQTGFRNLADMKAIGSTRDVNILASFDTLSNSESTYRLHLRKGDNPLEDVVEKIPAINTGDPAALRDFIIWGLRRAPATNILLILWNHGGGWKEDDIYAQFRALPNRALQNREELRGVGRRQRYRKALFMSTAAKILSLDDPHQRWICADDTSMDFLDNQELTQALTEAQATTGQKLDIIGMDACLMSMLEVGYQLRNNGRYLVSSQENEPLAGWPYTAILKLLTTQPEISPEELSRQMVGQYLKTYGVESRTLEAATLSALDLMRVDEVATRLGVWAQRWLAISPRDTLADDALRQARSRAFRFRDQDYVDLSDLLLRFEEAYDGPRVDSGLRLAAADVRSLLVPGGVGSLVVTAGGNRVRNIQRRYYNEGATGVSVYLPMDGFSQFYDRLEMIQNRNAAPEWATLLKNLNHIDLGRQARVAAILASSTQVATPPESEPAYSQEGVPLSSEQVSSPELQAASTPGQEGKHSPAPALRTAVTEAQEIPPQTPAKGRKNRFRFIRRLFTERTTPADKETPAMVSTKPADPPAEITDLSGEQVDKSRGTEEAISKSAIDAPANTPFDLSKISADEVRQTSATSRDESIVAEKEEMAARSPKPIPAAEPAPVLPPPALVNTRTRPVARPVPAKPVAQETTGDLGGVPSAKRNGADDIPEFIAELMRAAEERRKRRSAGDETLGKFIKSTGHPAEPPAEESQPDVPIEAGLPAGDGEARPSRAQVDADKEASDNTVQVDLLNEVLASGDEAAATGEGEADKRGMDQESENISAAPDHTGSPENQADSPEAATAVTVDRSLAVQIADETSGTVPILQIIGAEPAEGKQPSAGSRPNDEEPGQNQPALHRAEQVDALQIVTLAMDEGNRNLDQWRQVVENIPVEVLQLSLKLFMGKLERVLGVGLNTEVNVPSVGPFELDTIQFRAAIGSEGEFKLLGSGIGGHAQTGVVFTLHRRQIDPKKRDL